MNPSQQRGVALLLCLVILLVLTLLALSGMQGGVMQERMASAQRDGVVALEVAEAALREVEGILDGLADLDDFGGTAGYYDMGDAPGVFEETTWDPEQTHSVAASAVDGITPRYFVEYLGKVDLSGEEALPRDLTQYEKNATAELESARIVIMAQGPSGQSRRIIEAYYLFELGAGAGG